MNDKQLELLAQVFHGLTFADTKAGVSFDIEPLIVVFIIFIWQKARLVVEHELDSEPKVQTVDLKEDVIIVLETCIDRVSIIELPLLVLLERDIKGPHSV